MLLCLVLIIIATLAYQKLVLIQEGFKNKSVADTESSTCPTKLTAVRKKGIVFCNDKDNIPVCTLGANGTNDDIPACSEIIKKYFEDQAVKFCPPSMPNYFENPPRNTSGCTSGTLNQTRTGPAIDSAIQCSVYDSDLDTTTQSSCFNQKQLETTVLFGEKSTKNLIPIAITKPAAYITVMQYTRPGTSLPNGCVPNAHAQHIIKYMRSHIDKSLPADRQQMEITGLAMAEQFIKTGKFVGSCEAQRKVYVDRTLQESDLVPQLPR